MMGGRVGLDTARGSGLSTAVGARGVERPFTKRPYRRWPRHGADIICRQTFRPKTTIRNHIFADEFVYNLWPPCTPV